MKLQKIALANECVDVSSTLLSRVFDDNSKIIKNVIIIGSKNHCDSEIQLLDNVNP